MAKPVRIIVHAGFHKTGTTSLQDFLTDNRNALAPHLSYFGKMDFRDAGAHARIYAQRPFPWRLWRFRRSLRRFLHELDTARLAPVVILSRETFSGGMPGHLRLGGALMTSYLPAARTLSDVIVAELRRRFAADADITFFYTTRDRAPWIASVHGHLLRSIRMRDDLQQFRARMADLQSPEAQAAAMSHHLAPIPVVTARLEEYKSHPEGPAAALLDLVDIPASLRANLSPAPRSNRGQDTALRDAFLTLNRTTRSRSVLRAAKARLIATGDTA